MGNALAGRTTVRMERLLGRTDDMIVVRGVNVFPSQIETVLLQAGEVEPHYQIVIDRAADYMDELDVLVEVPSSIHGSRQRLVNWKSSLHTICRVLWGSPAR